MENDSVKIDRGKMNSVLYEIANNGGAPLPKLASFWVSIFFLMKETSPCNGGKWQTEAWHYFINEGEECFRSQQLSSIVRRNLQYKDKRRFYYTYDKDHCPDRLTES